MASEISGKIKEKIHYFKVRVYYEDTDFTGIVYHANYLKFAARGRINYLRLASINNTDLTEESFLKDFAKK